MIPATTAAPLTEQSLAQGVRFVCRRDPDLARVQKALGPPPLWSREPGFPTLVHIILEQQVSLASARAAFEKLLRAASPLTPDRFLALDGPALKTIGFSRQKMAYARHLACSIVERRIDLDAIAAMDDRSAASELIQIKGIGPWTASIYLLMALRRPDVWPPGDLALRVALQEVKRWPSLPEPRQMKEWSLRWSPWRAVAARLLWHYYLSKE